jgi:hypothetical protein
MNNTRARLPRIEKKTETKWHKTTKQHPRVFFCCPRAAPAARIPMAEDISPEAGEVSPMAGDISPKPGEAPPMAGEASPRALSRGFCASRMAVPVPLPRRLYSCLPFFNSLLT